MVGIYSTRIHEQELANEQAANVEISFHPEKWPVKKPRKPGSPGLKSKESVEILSRAILEGPELGPETLDSIRLFEAVHRRSSQRLSGLSSNGSQAAKAKDSFEIHRAGSLLARAFKGLSRSRSMSPRRRMSSNVKRLGKYHSHIVPPAKLSKNSGVWNDSMFAVNLSVTKNKRLAAGHVRKPQEKEVVKHIATCGPLSIGHIAPIDKDAILEIGKEYPDVVAETALPQEQTSEAENEHTCPLPRHDGSYQTDRLAFGGHFRGWGAAHTRQIDSILTSIPSTAVKATTECEPSFGLSSTNSRAALPLRFTQRPRKGQLAPILTYRTSPSTISGTRTPRSSPKKTPVAGSPDQASARSTVHSPSESVISEAASDATSAIISVGRSAQMMHFKKPLGPGAPPSCPLPALPEDRDVAGSHHAMSQHSAKEGSGGPGMISHAHLERSPPAGDHPRLRSPAKLTPSYQDIPAPSEGRRTPIATTVLPESMISFGWDEAREEDGRRIEGQAQTQKPRQHDEISREGNSRERRTRALKQRDLEKARARSCNGLSWEASRTLGSGESSGSETDDSIVQLPSSSVESTSPGPSPRTMMAPISRFSAWSSNGSPRFRRASENRLSPIVIIAEEESPDMQAIQWPMPRRNYEDSGTQYSPQKVQPPSVRVSPPDTPGDGGHQRSMRARHGPVDERFGERRRRSRGQTPSPVRALNGYMDGTSNDGRESVQADAADAPSYDRASWYASELEARVEARLAAFERRTILLEAALLAVINASAAMNAGMQGGRAGSGAERFGGPSPSLSPVDVKLEAMLAGLGGGGGGGGGGGRDSGGVFL